MMNTTLDKRILMVTENDASVNIDLLKMKFRDLRISKGLTQQQVSNRTGLSLTTINRAESLTKDSTIALETAAKLCALYGVRLFVK